MKKINVVKFQKQTFDYAKDNRHENKDQDFTILLTGAGHTKVKKVRVEEEEV